MGRTLVVALSLMVSLAASASDAPVEAEAVPPSADADLEDRGPVEAAPAPAPPSKVEPAEKLEDAEGAEEELVEIDVRKRVVPTYPDELEVLYGQRAVRCVGDVWLDKHGLPLRIAMTDCPDGFHLAALSAMAQWRWEPPEGVVPAGGVRTAARTGFVRRDRRYFPGVTYFRSPERVTAASDLELSLKSGKMPKYPRQVSAGDDVCLVEVVVDTQGRSHSPVVDDCAPPFRDALRRVVKTWRWWWKDAPERGTTQTVSAEVVFRL